MLINSTEICSLDKKIDTIVQGKQKNSVIIWTSNYGILVKDFEVSGNIFFVCSSFDVGLKYLS